MSPKPDPKPAPQPPIDLTTIKQEPILIESDEDDLLITGTDKAVPDAEILKSLAAAELEVKQKSAKVMIDTLEAKRYKFVEEKILVEEWNFIIR